MYTFFIRIAPLWEIMAATTTTSHCVTHLEFRGVPFQIIA